MVISRELKLQRETGYWRGGFDAMASPCEVLMEIDAESKARRLLAAVADEAWRIERKFSRYRNDNIIHRINNAGGEPVEVDGEAARLLDFADRLYRISDGLFDVTSGVLRKAWNFDGSDKVPEQELIDSLLLQIGWDRVRWQPPRITLQAGMQLDLGGIGKEYAVDRAVHIAQEHTGDSVLINMGGDLAVSGPRRDDGFWSVGRQVTGREQTVALFQLRRGAIATSGDAHRFLLRDGIRYSHLLNPNTGWPVAGAPHTVSVAAPTCVEAGMMSTLAMLQGERAEAFLRLQDMDFWID